MTARNTTKTAKPKPRKRYRDSLNTRVRMIELHLEAEDERLRTLYDGIAEMLAQTSKRIDGLVDRVDKIEREIWGWCIGRVDLDIPECSHKSDTLRSRLSSIELRMAYPEFHDRLRDAPHEASVSNAGDAVGEHYRIVGEWRPATPKEVAEMEGEGWWRRFLSPLWSWRRA